MTENIIVGLDIGGANLKAATSTGQTRSVSFELWKQPHQLGTALLTLLEGWHVDRMAVTMTGELCDCFPTKRDGVGEILAQVEQAFPNISIEVWSTNGYFLPSRDARRNPLQVAAANWHALATMLAADFPNALLIDVGSTTSDIIPIVAGKPASVGLTDPARLRSRELVYTGVRRTPLCALLQEEVAAELFATTLDAYLLLDMVIEDADDCATADGRPATKEFAHARLARMLGGDAETIPFDEVRQLASRVYEQQRSLVVKAINKVAGGLEHPPEVVLLSGSGEFLAHAALEITDLFVLPVEALSDRLGRALSGCACAYAVARLTAISCTKPG